LNTDDVAKPAGAGKGIFAEYQPKYAAQNVITFPVGRNKKPAIKHWQRLGLDGSARLAEKFSDVDTFGFPLGPRSGVTILDVDTKDKSILDQAQSRYGQSPLVVESGGGYHAYYRYGGERRHIRPWGDDVPIDVLGNGYAVGAPSVATKGQYKIIHGSLDDLKSLPPLHVMLDDLRKPIPEGKRNQSLFRMSLEQAAHADDFETLMDAIRTKNMDCTIPLPESELEAVARSAWNYETKGTNLVGRGKAVVLSHSLIDRVMAHSLDAYVLLSILKRHNWGRDFFLASAMAATMGWGQARWRLARDGLVRLGIIACLHEGGMGPNDPPIYGWVES
jgi:Bifunctional DNA primase/polymerase, N-terminal/Primase C terminal 1 (PriCT-1)